MPVLNKVIIVTGGGTGVGRETSLAMARLGYHVIVNYSRSREEAEETAREISALGVRAFAVQADVADDAACRAIVAFAVKELGRVDVLVNCAGTTDFIPFQDLDAVTDETWQRLYQVNVVGAFHCARAVREPMLAVGGGTIVNVSSVAAQLGQGSSIPYCCTKAAVDNLTVSLARTLAPHIRVNGVAPGFIEGRWTQGGLGAKYDSIKQAYERTLPLGRVCQPQDIADGIVSLITGSKLVTGQTLTVDAGMMISGFQVKFD
ncbi:3-oxoacyl-[acyl-carrier-protein] reductase FabG [Anatilimnocola aggregata]|uniref:3-oxoacyl-[acyl-carrier-protein] reductase FabG n=1 Tax=Anatilimnocola aggregata TaxID=2528021 RepID=A0A517Y5P1_9BACT|nr:SDR family oxidoreductase [Anatilimnocola aggregata]QDU25557.1 3-oxoacyl-[acyl-carrier-protein] reductase FabG [Anatilimnocola aggregata]